MTLLKEIGYLLQKELLIEWRQKYAISGIALYVFSTIFVVYFAFTATPSPNAWIALFWIIILFASVNAVAKSFMQENSYRQLYYYSLADPLAIIISKVIYNSLLLFLLSTLCFLAFSFITGNPVEKQWQFFQVLILGSVGFSISFTFISAISAKARNSATLMVILGFPVIIPILLTLIRLSRDSLGLMEDTSIDKDIMILIAIDLILLALSFLLFPYLWRD